MKISTLLTLAAICTLSSVSHAAQFDPIESAQQRADNIIPQVTAPGPLNPTTIVRTPVDMTLQCTYSPTTQTTTCVKL